MGVGRGPPRYGVSRAFPEGKRGAAWDRQRALWDVLWDAVEAAGTRAGALASIQAALGNKSQRHGARADAWERLKLLGVPWERLRAARGRVGAPENALGGALGCGGRLRHARGSAAEHRRLGTDRPAWSARRRLGALGSALERL